MGKVYLMLNEFSFRALSPIEFLLLFRSVLLLKGVLGERKIGFL